METSPYNRESSTTARPAAAAIPTIHVPDKGSTRLAVFAVLLQLACAIAIGYLFQWRTGLDMAIGGGAVFLVMFYSFFAWGNRRAIRRFLQEIHRGDGPPTIARLEQACIAAGRLSPAWLASAVREAMPELRVLQIREDMSEEGAFLTPPPFDHGFGPTPLRQSDPLFRGLSGLPRGEDWNRAKEFWRTSGLGQEIKRTSRIALVIAALMVGVMLIVVGVNAVLDLLRGRLPSRIPSFIWIWAVCLLFIGLVRLFRPSEWLLVPGGLIVRQGTWRSGQWQVREFSGESSTLICWKNAIAVASADGADARNVTSHELETLLRAWFSDAPRPPLENMGDLR